MEQEILNIAIENLSNETDMLIKPIEINELNHNFYDGDIKFFSNNFSFQIPFTVKRKITIAQLPFLRENLSRKALVIFEYAPKSVKENLRKLNINYLEMSGNAFISLENIYIFINTKKRIKLEEFSKSTAFSTSGLKFIYHLLSDSSAINLSYRELGKISGVSIDTIGRVYKELVRDRYIVKLNSKNYKIIDYERLFNDWVTLFNKTLRPKLKKRTFRLNSNQDIRTLVEKNIKGKIGGELAAEFLTQYNIAEKANIYITGSFVELALELNLRPDKDGQISMIEQFWKESPQNYKKTVGLPLIFADLISEPNPRNLETAKLLFNEYKYQPI